VREGHLAELFGEAGLAHVESATLTVSVRHPTFEDWWEPFTAGVGPAGAYVRSLDPERRVRLRNRCREGFPEEGLTVTARAWAARGLV
jgi:hypothetical protein